MNAHIDVAGFASRITNAESLDRDPRAMADLYSAFVEAGLTAPWIEGENFDTLIALGEASGAFGFLALQQWVAAGHEGELVAGPWCGVAFNHLKSPCPDTPRETDGRVNGRIPWFTGAGIFRACVLGYLDEEGNEAYAFVEATDRPEFRHGERMNLLAMSGTATCAVQVTDLAVRPFARHPAGSRAAGDAKSYAWQTPLMFGVALAACRQLGDSAVERFQRLRARALAPAEADGGLALREEVGAFAVDVCRRAALAAGGKSIVAGAPEERRYREALVLNLMAADPAVRDAAVKGCG